MDSPHFDSNSPFGSYQNNWILPEESILSSQPSLFLLDMEKEMKQEVKMAVKQIKKERGENMEKDAVLTTEWKVKGKKKVAKQAEKEKAAQIEKAMVPKTEMMTINEHVGGEKAMVETDNTEGEKKNADAITTSFEPVKKYLRSIIEMDEAALKTICKEKGIVPKGRPSMKHKYAFVLFQDVLMQLEM
jgi:hypothetical protein